VATAVFLMLSHWDPLFGLSAGFLALCLNFFIAVVLTLLTPALRADPQMQRRTSELPPLN
jgi:hypothetical protein